MTHRTVVVLGAWILPGGVQKTPDGVVELCTFDTTLIMDEQAVRLALLPFGATGDRKKEAKHEHA